jgi:hypothetical protein
MWILRVSHLIVASIIIVIVLSAQPAFSKQGVGVVGHSTVEIVLTGSLSERRPIDVKIWYPASEKNFDTAPLATYQSRLYGVPLIPARWDPLSWRITSTGRPSRRDQEER